MSVAYYIVLNTNAQDFDTFVNGKAVAHSYNKIEALCQQAGLPGPSAFIGQAAAEFEDMLDEAFELPAGEEESEKWFEPEAGIVWVDSLTSLITQNPATLSRAQAVLDELQEYRSSRKSTRHPGKVAPCAGYLSRSGRHCSIPSSSK